MAATVKHALIVAQLADLQARVAALEARSNAPAQAPTTSAPDREARIAASIARREALRAKANH